MAFRIQPPPEGTLYSVLQKAKPGWSTKDLLKVYQKLQKVSITDGESLARAVSEGSLNQILTDAGERKLKPSTLQLLRLASRDPTRKVANLEEDLPLLGARHCFCGNCIRVPMCQPKNPETDVLSMKLPSIKSLGPPPLMPSKRLERWQPRQQKVLAPLPRVKSEVKFEPRSRLLDRPGDGKLRAPTPPKEVWPKKVLAPILATVPERTRRSVVLPQRFGTLALARRSAEEVEADEEKNPGTEENSMSSFHSYGTFVEMQGTPADDHEAAYSSQESYAMSFEDPPSWRSFDNENEDVESFSDEFLEEFDGTERCTEALKELEPELDETLHPRTSSQVNSKSVDERQQIAAARRQQQRRRMIRAYG